MISIPYSRTNGVYTFTDALILEDEAYAAMTQADIVAMQDERFAAWVAIVESASNNVIEEVVDG